MALQAQAVKGLARAFATFEPELSKTHTRRSARQIAENWLYTTRLVASPYLSGLSS